MAFMEHLSVPTFNDRTSLILSIRQLCYVTSDKLFIYTAEGGALMSRYYLFICLLLFIVPLSYFFLLKIVYIDHNTKKKKLDLCLVLAEV